MRMDGVDERRKFGTSFGDGCWSRNSVACGGQWCEPEGASSVASHTAASESEAHGPPKSRALVIRGSCRHSATRCTPSTRRRTVSVPGRGFQRTQQHFAQVCQYDQDS